MNKQTFLLLPTALLLTALLIATSLSAGQKGQQSKPFLILGKLPHLTRLIRQQWDNPALGLSERQRKHLLVVRKKTVSGANRLGKEIAALEQQVVEGSTAGKAPEELRPLVEKIASLKAEATMLHLQCIADTRAILSPKQLEVLMAAARP